MNPIDRLALEVALRAEVRRYQQYDRLPKTAEVARAHATEPKNFKSAIGTLAILASVPPGVELEGKTYFWNLTDGLIITRTVKPVVVTVGSDDPDLWWNSF